MCAPSISEGRHHSHCSILSTPTFSYNYHISHYNEVHSILSLLYYTWKNRSFSI